MNEISLEEILRKSYAKLVRDLLLIEFRTDDELSQAFHTTDFKKQKEIEQEIDRKAKDVAFTIVEKLKKKGYIEKEPSKRVLNRIFKEALEEYGVSKL